MGIFDFLTGAGKKPHWDPEEQRLKFSPEEGKRREEEREAEEQSSRDGFVL